VAVDIRVAAVVVIRVVAADRTVAAANTGNL
jgi:hypothetical protein